MIENISNYSKLKYIIIYSKLTDEQFDYTNISNLSCIKKFIVKIQII